MFIIRNNCAMNWLPIYLKDFLKISSNSHINDRLRLIRYNIYTERIRGMRFPVNGWINDKDFKMATETNETNWYDNYSGATVDNLSAEDKERIQVIEDKLHELFAEAEALFPFYCPQL